MDCCYRGIGGLVHGKGEVNHYICTIFLFINVHFININALIGHARTTIGSMINIYESQMFKNGKKENLTPSNIVIR